MGTYTSLTLNGYELGSTKGAVVPEVMTVFVERDRQALWRHEDGSVADGFGDNGDVYVSREVVYQVRAQSAARRLDVMGFTLERCRREFEDIRAAKLAFFRDEEVDVTLEGTAASSADSWVQDEIRLLESLGFDDYVNALKNIIDRKLLRYQLPKDLDRSTLSVAERHVLLGHDDDWPYHGFFCDDVRGFLRVALSLVPPESLLIQDISALVSAQYFTEDQLVRDAAVSKLLERYPENAPRILLTEGTSDADILKKALQVLYPELVGYYTFFDFDSSNIGGGASRLVQAVKAFSAAGIANRVVAILDNDGAAHEAAKGLRSTVLPPNLAVLHYPARDWMRSYQAPGPLGEAECNLNGIAGNIETYLGSDLLCTNGIWEPIEWGGKEGSRQGELVNKRAVAIRWRDKAELCLAGSRQDIHGDWEDLRAIWHAIFRAFND